MTSPPSLALRVRQAILRQCLTAPGDTVLVAVSGGVDSVVLLHLLNDLAEDLNITLHAAHLNHDLRGTEADRDQAFVTELCAQLKVPLTCLKERPVPRSGESLQTAARTLRQLFLQQTATRLGAARIATGHHSDDQAETVIMRLITGASSTGLAAMRPRRGKLIRPLLAIPKARLIAHAKSHGIDHVEDASNVDPKYLRNRIRAEIMPRLAAINPNLTDTLTRQAADLATQADFLVQQSVAPIAQLITPMDDGCQIDCAGLAALHPALAQRVVYAALLQVLPRPEQVHVSQVLALAQGETGKSIDLPGGVRSEKSYGMLRLMSSPPSHTDAVAAIVVAVPGITAIPWAGIRLETAWGPKNFTGWVHFDRGTFSQPLLARPRQSGDRFQPVGLNGHTKKVKDFLINAKLPRAQRDRLPLLCAPEGILWLVGVRENHRFTTFGMHQAGPPPLAVRILPLDESTDSVHK